MSKGHKVLTPNKGFSGVRNGVKFKNGVGYCSKEKAEELIKILHYYCPALGVSLPKNTEPGGSGYKEK